MMMNLSAMLWKRYLTGIRRRNLKKLVRNCYFENQKRYGAGRIAKALTKRGVKIGRRKVHSLLKEENLTAIQTRAFKPKTTDSKGTRAAENLLVGGAGQENSIGKVIIGDITDIRLRGGKFCYLAIWQDKYTRRKNALRQSMSSKGDCYSNAQAESFFSRFKAELMENGVFEDINHARLEIFSYIEGYYNLRRLHSSLG